MHLLRRMLAHIRMLTDRNCTYASDALPITLYQRGLAGARIPNLDIRRIARERARIAGYASLFRVGRELALFAKAFIVNLLQKKISQTEYFTVGEMKWAYEYFERRVEFVLAA